MRKRIFTACWRREALRLQREGHCCGVAGARREQPDSAGLPREPEAYAAGPMGRPTDGALEPNGNESPPGRAALIGLRPGTPKWQRGPLPPAHSREPNIDTAE